MKLKNNIEQIINNTGINVEDKTIYSLNKFIYGIDKKPYKSKDFNSLVFKINKDYVLKSKKQEEYFLKNIVHSSNKKTNEPLFDFSKVDYSKNFNISLNKQTLKKLSNVTENLNILKNDRKKKKLKKKTYKGIKNYYKDLIIQYSENLYNISSIKNTSFLDNLASKYGHKKSAKVKYLDFKNKDKTPVMLTITLDKSFRKYIKSKDVEETMILGNKNGLVEVNKNINLEEIIEKSYFKLNGIFQTIYDNLKQRNKRCGDKNKLDYILVFEPHKSLTLHLHILFYCNDVQLANLETCWNNYLKDKTSSQKKGQDFKIIDKKIATSATYLSKYLIKEYSENEDVSFYTKYKSYFSKFNMFRTSNFYNTTQKKIDLMYQYLTKNYPDILETIKSSSIPLYEVLEKFELEGLFEFEKEKLKTINFNREQIKDKYDYCTNVLSFEVKETKNLIIDSIDYFSSITNLSRIKSATFNYDHQKIDKILNSYNIDTSNLIEDKDIPPDKFYEVGIYEIFNYDLENSIYLINSVNI